MRESHIKDYGADVASQGIPCPMLYRLRVTVFHGVAPTKGEGQCIVCSHVSAVLGFITLLWLVWMERDGRKRKEVKENFSFLTFGYENEIWEHL